MAIKGLNANQTSGRKAYPPKCREQVVKIADIFMSFLIIFPLVIFYWRGTWDLYDYYFVVDCPDLIENITDTHRIGIEHENYKADCLEFTGNYISALIGCAICIIFNCVSPFMDSSATACSDVAFHVTSRLYSYAYALAYLGQWRGTWNLVDAYSPDYSWESNLVGLCVCHAITTLLRINRHWTSTPWSVTFDLDRSLFVSTPWLRSKPEDGMWHYCVDEMLSQFICVNLNISTWRCLWNCLDDIIFPDQLELSAVITLIGGAVILLILFIIQHPLSQFSKTLDRKHVQRTLLDACFNIVANIGVVSMWRGLWNLVAEYVIPDRLHGGWSCHFIGTIGLMVFMAFRSVYDNSVDVDGECLDGGGITPDKAILKSWLDHTKKLNKKTNENGSVYGHTSTVELGEQKTNTEQSGHCSLLNGVDKLSV